MRRRKKRKRITRERRKKLRLWRFWRKKRGGTTPIQLIRIVIEIEYFSLRKRAVKEFLNIKGPVFDDFYRMLNAARDILEKDSCLYKRFWGKFLDICTSDNLAELVISGEAEAAKELFRRIDARVINNQKAKQILMVLFEKITDAQSRKIVWLKIKKLEPNNKELTELLEISGMARLLEIADEIKKALVMNKKKRDKGDKIIERLKKLSQRIKEKQE